MKNYYNEPTQVLFHDESGWNAGIAFGDKVVCGCCGHVYSIAELIEDCDEDLTYPIYEYKYWVSITNDISGDFTELPEGLELTEDYVIREVR